MPYSRFGVPKTSCALLADDYSISLKCKSNLCLKFLVAARRQREMMVIISNAENVKSAVGLDIPKFEQTSLFYSVSYFNWGGLGALFWRG